MKLSTIDTGFFKLDGGAMFGVVPKSIWENLNPADEKNLCSWALRCLLVEEGNRLILIDCGLGNKDRRDIRIPWRVRGLAADHSAYSHDRFERARFRHHQVADLQAFDGD